VHEVRIIHPLKRSVCRMFECLRGNMDTELWVSLMLDEAGVVRCELNENSWVHRSVDACVITWTRSFYGGSTDPFYLGHER